MDANVTNIILGVISASGLFTTALITGWYATKVKKLELRNEQAQKQVSKLKAELTCINVLFEYKLIALLNSTVNHIFKETKAERFIILFAINGKTDFNFVSVCYEKTKTDKGSGAMYRYVRVAIDDDYRQMLKHVEKDKQVYLDVENMPDCLLKNIYQSIVEGVTFSGIHFIARHNIDQDNDSLVYCSIATTNNEDFTRSEKTSIKVAMDNLRGHASQMNFSLNI
jgi:hypothetical protein